MTHLSPEWRQKLLDAGFPAEELKLGVAEEILRRLPKTLESSGDYFFLNCHQEEVWGITYYSMTQDYHCWINDEKVGGSGDTLANAAAAMWCYLAENNLLPNP